MFFRFFIILLFLSSCINSTGFKGEPKNKNPKKIGINQTGVTLKFHNLNKINTASLPKFADIKKKKIKN